MVDCRLLCYLQHLQLMLTAFPQVCMLFKSVWPAGCLIYNYGLHICFNLEDYTFIDMEDSYSCLQNYRFQHSDVPDGYRIMKRAISYAEQSLNKFTQKLTSVGLYMLVSRKAYLGITAIFLGWKNGNAILF